MKPIRDIDNHPIKGASLMDRYSKAIAAVVGAVVAVLVVFNVDVSEEVQGTIIAVATGLVTLLAPRNAD